MVDLDGMFEYSDWKIQEFHCSKAEIFPNPIWIGSGEVTINLNGGPIPTTMVLYNQTGGVLKTIDTSEMEEEILQVDLDISVSGVYYLKIGTRVLHKIMVHE